MPKAVLTTKVSPDYDDLPENRYHFPKAYLNQVSKAVGDWIVYYEPRRSTGELSSGGGRQAYFATARVESIYPDPDRADHFYAEISNYPPFVRPVLFKEGAITTNQDSKKRMAQPIKARLAELFACFPMMNTILFGRLALVM